MKYAGFWDRLVAFAVDAMAIAVLVTVITGGRAGVPIYGGPLALGWRHVMEAVISLAYFTLFWSWVGGGQTPGMQICGLRVVDPDGEPIGIRAASLRWAGLVVGTGLLFMGIIWMAADPRRRGWHDRLSGSLVVLTDPGESVEAESWRSP